ncbi:MAG: hypothetical protein GY953_20905, partial [bacterium]|nr:hypothetical protein [bacterium]
MLVCENLYRQRRHCRTSPRWIPARNRNGALGRGLLGSRASRDLVVPSAQHPAGPGGLARTLVTFHQLNSRLQGHPCMNTTPGVGMSTGSLGHGMSVALGMAL